jgi:hypothetical protein
VIPCEPSLLWLGDPHKPQTCSTPEELARPLKIVGGAVSG